MQFFIPIPFLINVIDKSYLDYISSKKNIVIYIKLNYFFRRLHYFHLKFSQYIESK